MSAILTPDQVNILVASAMRDSALKQELLNDPHAVAQAHLGVEIPSTKTLHVVQAEAQTLTVVIPPRPPDWPADLSLEDATTQLLSERPATDEKSRKVMEIQMQLTAKAWQDESFKQRLLHDAKATMVQELGVTLPEVLDIQFFVEDDHHQYVVLPPGVAGKELSDEELETVAGGEVIAVTVVTAVSLGSAVVGGAVSATLTQSTSW